MSVAQDQSAQSANFWFRKHLEACIPELTDPTATDFDKVGAIRQWVYSAVPSAVGNSCTLEEKYDFSIYKEDTARVLYLIDRFSLGYYCSGTAETFASVCRLFGFEAWCYNMGAESGMASHVTSIVKFVDEGAQVYSVQDSYFNYTLMAGGKPLDFYRLLELIADRRSDEVEIREGDTSCKPTIIDESVADEWRKQYSYAYKMGPVTYANGRATFCTDLSLKNFVPMSDFEDWIESRIGRRGFAHLFLFPLSVSGDGEQTFAGAAKAALENLQGR